MYDLKHELISVQIKLENAEKELAKMKEENNDLQMQIVKLETERRIAESKRMRVPKRLQKQAAFVWPSFYVNRKRSY